MFVITLRYLAPLDEIDALLPAHRAWLDEHFRAGEFLASGRQVPRLGGVILAAGTVGRERLDAIVAEDPFNVNNAAEYTVVEFAPNQAAPGFEALVEG